MLNDGLTRATGITRGRMGLPFAPLPCACHGASHGQSLTCITICALCAGALLSRRSTLLVTELPFLQTRHITHFDSKQVRCSSAVGAYLGTLHVC